MRLFPLLFVLFSQSLLAQVSSNFLEEYQPKAEAGIGSIGLQTPYYAGAKQNQFRFIPFPFGVYRGEVFRADDEGTRARLLKPSAYELGISLGLNFSVKSEDTNLRKGMHNLDTIIQLGPRFLYRFLTKNPSQRLNLTLALKGAFSTNFRDRTQERGLLIEPEVSFWNRFSELDATFYTYFGFSFTSRKFSGYYYDIEPAFSTAQRPSYRAKSGLFDTSMGVGLSKEIRDGFMVFTGASYKNLDWAANKNSPLIETTHNFSMIVGFVWLFYESAEKIRVIKLKE